MAWAESGQGGTGIRGEGPVEKQGQKTGHSEAMPSSGSQLGCASQYPNIQGRRIGCYLSNVGRVKNERSSLIYYWKQLARKYLPDCQQMLVRAHSSAYDCNMLREGVIQVRCHQRSFGEVLVPQAVLEGICESLCFWVLSLGFEQLVIHGEATLKWVIVK